jgi:hypothetical protein
MLRRELTPGYDTEAGCQLARDFVATHKGAFDCEVELDLDAFRSAWLALIADELARRAS